MKKVAAVAVLLLLGFALPVQAVTTIPCYNNGERFVVTHKFVVGDFDDVDPDNLDPDKFVVGDFD